MLSRNIKKVHLTPLFLEINKMIAIIISSSQVINMEYLRMKIGYHVHNKQYIKMSIKHNKVR